MLTLADRLKLIVEDAKLNEEAKAEKARNEAVRDYATLQLAQRNEHNPVRGVTASSKLITDRITGDDYYFYIVVFQDFSGAELCYIKHWSNSKDDKVVLADDARETHDYISDVTDYQDKKIKQETPIKPSF